MYPSNPKQRYLLSPETVFGLNSISNQCIITHIAALANALKTTEVTHVDEVRLVKRFLSNL